MSGDYPAGLSASLERLAASVTPLQGTSYTLHEDRDSRLERLAKDLEAASIDASDSLARSLAELRDVLAAYDTAGQRKAARYSREVIREPQKAAKPKSDRRASARLTAPSWVYRSEKCLSDFRRGYEAGRIRLGVHLSYDDLIEKHPKPRMLQGHCDQARRAYASRSSAFCYGVAAAMYIKAEQKAAA